MSVLLDDTQRLLASMLRDLLDAAHPTEAVIAAAEDPHSFDDSMLWSRLAEVGCTGLAVPEAFGGAGGSMLDLVVALEAAGYATLPGSLLASAGLGLSLLLPLANQAECAAQLVTSAASGEQRLAVALETDVAVTPRANGVVIDGRLPLVLEAGVADVILLTVADAVVALPVTGEGVTVSPALTIDVSRRFHDVDLDAVCVPPDGVLARGSAAAAATATLQERGAIATAADALGSAHRALDDAVAYARVRKQFGRQIGSFQALKHLLVDTHVAVDAARSATWYAARVLERGAADLELAVHAAKALASDAAILAAGNAVQVHGGIGFTREVTCHLHVKRAQLNQRILGGAAEHRRAIAALLRDSGLPPGW